MRYISKLPSGEFDDPGDEATPGEFGFPGGAGAFFSMPSNRNEANRACAIIGISDAKINAFAFLTASSVGSPMFSSLGAVIIQKARAESLKADFNLAYAFSPSTIGF